MIRMLTAILKISTLLVLAFDFPVLNAVSLNAIKTGNNPMMQVAGKDDQKRVARVRIALDLRNYEKIVVRAQNGQQRFQYRTVDPLKRVLRARIEETNHFYVDGWHVETIPQSWSKASRILTVKMRYYKRYGINQELEEFVGEHLLKGYLTGKDHLYVLRGQAKSRFTDKFGNPIVEVVAGVSPVQRKKQPVVRGAVKDKAF